MVDYLTTLAEQLGGPVWLVLIILTWSYAWKLLALWKSARKSSIVWFIVLGLVNTVGILEILYIFVFSKINFGRISEKPQAKVQAKKAVTKRKSTSKPKRKTTSKK